MTQPLNAEDPQIDIAHYEQVLQRLRAELDASAVPTEADELVINELLGLDLDQPPQQR